MKARILYILFCGALYFCSTPRGFAKEANAEEARADFFAAEVSGDSDRQAAAVFNDAGLVQFAECGFDGESSVDGEEEARRESKRAASHKTNVFKCRFAHAFSANVAAKGVAKHPGSQDARQELTATVRFLQMAALAC